jgi:hypothetical protein
MGPAYFFALSEFLVISAGSYGLSDSHPESDLRLKFLHKRIMSGEKNFAAIFKSVTKTDLSIDINSHALKATPSSDDIFSDMLEILERDPGPVTSAVIAEMHGELAKVDDKIFDLVLNYLNTTNKDLIYTAEMYERDLGLFVEPMLYAIPPIEYELDGKMVPVEFPSILNVGWAVLLCMLNGMQIGDPEMPNAKRVEILQGLISKAVELSEARRRWDTA